MRGRSIVVAAALLAAATSAAQEVSVLQPLQMPDGSQQWRFSAKKATHEKADEALIDLIAQRLAEKQWCPRGWEEVRRTEPSKGFVLIEGRCK